MELKCDEIKALSYYERYFGQKCTISDVTADSSATFIIRSSNTFEYSKTIQDVDFQKCNLYDIPRETFATFANLKKIQLNSCGIEDIHKYSFNYASNLQELRLRSNKLKKLPNSVFTNAPALHTIDLSSNEISEIEKNAFVGLSNLEYVTLSNNKIVVLEENVFRELTNLISLRLDSNKLQVIEENLFANCINLTEIRLDTNEIAIINADAFSKLKRLKFLNLGSNRLPSINIEDSNLERLWMPYNKLTHLTVNKNLKLLYAPYNQLESINFNGNAEMIELKLRNNHITSVSNFTSLTKVEVLDLSYNPIASLSVASFSRMSDLVKLNLEYTNITPDSLTYGTFAHNVNLTQLDLSYNQLGHIDFNIFSALSQLTHLKIDGNNLTDIPYETIKNHFPKLSLISLTDNDWNCTYLSGMIKRLKQLNMLVFVFPNLRVYDETNVDGIRCVKNNTQHVQWVAPVEHLDDNEINSDSTPAQPSKAQGPAFVSARVFKANLTNILNKIADIESSLDAINANMQAIGISKREHIAIADRQINDDESQNRDMIVKSEVSFIKIILCLMCFIMIVFMLITIIKFIKTYAEKHRFYYPSESLRRSTATIQTTMEHVM